MKDLLNKPNLDITVKPFTERPKLNTTFIRNRTTYIVSAISKHHVIGTKTSILGGAKCPTDLIIVNRV